VRERYIHTHYQRTTRPKILKDIHQKRTNKMSVSLDNTSGNVSSILLCHCQIDQGFPWTWDLMGCFSHLHNFLVLFSTTNSYPKSTLVISSSQSWLKPHLVTSLILSQKYTFELHVSVAVLQD
jgi:hypothetical protein